MKAVQAAEMGKAAYAIGDSIVRDPQCREAFTRNSSEARKKSGVASIATPLSEFFNRFIDVLQRR